MLYGVTVAVLFPKVAPILLMEGRLIGCQDGFLNNIIVVNSFINSRDLPSLSQEYYFRDKISITIYGAFSSFL